MTSDPGLQLLLNQFAQSIGMPDLMLNEEGQCAVRFSGTITLEMSADEGRLLVYSDVGNVTPGTEDQLYPSLLQANLFWHSTHGATLSITDDQPPRVILAAQYDWMHLTPVQFEAHIEHFVDTAEKWLARLRNTDGAPDRSNVQNTDLATMGGHGDSARWDMLRG